MRRECTYEENQLIKQNISNALIPYDNIRNIKGNKVVPVLLGIFAGAAVGIPFALLLDVKYQNAVKFIILFAMLIMIEIFLLIWKKKEDNKSKKIAKQGDIRYYVNGATFLGYVEKDSEMYMVFTEDDLVDDTGNVFCLECPCVTKHTIKRGERIIIAYDSKGAYIPMKMTEQTRYLVPMERPMYFDTVDWSSVRRVPHPNAFFIDKAQQMINEVEAENLGIQHKIRKPKKIKYKKLVMFAGRKNEWNGNTVVEKFSVYEYNCGRIELNTYCMNINVLIPKDTVYGTIIYKYSRELDSEKKNMYYFVR